MHKKATVFEFTRYQFEPEKNRAVFFYTTKFSDQEPLTWTETILLPNLGNFDHIPPQMLKKLLENLHLMLGISYYKFYCAPKISLPYALSKSEADFFSIVYKKGLGEFFYKNNLNPNIAPKFPKRVTRNPQPFNRYTKLPVIGYPLQVTNRPLVGIGGGKDSIVSAELLKGQGIAFSLLNIETNKSSDIVGQVMKKIGKKSLTVKRILDEKVHQQHAYNGHIPVSAIYAFLGIFACALYGYDEFIVSNEHSSNFGNIRYKSLDINHQWSKSYEFEILFSQYLKNHITHNITYFSLLRSFYEIRIVKMFARYPKYFSHFSSCNKNFASTNTHQGLWCGQCAKCVFVFTLLSAFLSKKELVAMFGKNLYQDETLLPLFKDVLGFGSMKPFDCVGTFQEAQTALHMAQKKFSNDYIMRQLGKRAKFHKEVFETNKDSSIPQTYKFLGMEKILIAGFGKEGTVTKQYLKKFYPELKIGIADSKEGSGYLKKQTEFDLAIKTPGIQKELIAIPCTTATNLFFCKAKGSHTIVGITGSKGKSTTSTLIYEIIKASGKPVVFLGNIGQPMLEAFLKPVKKDVIFVLELSSYQLDDIQFSPDIAVVTNLFPEHMDFHGSLQNYYLAKKNIINFQGADDFFIYNPQNKDLKKWLKEYRGQAIPFAKEVFETKLLGEHNQSNINAAVTAARILKIKESTIKEMVKNFNGLRHRLQNVGEFCGITFYDDAIATTPEATIMAIKTLGNVDTIFLGGSDRGYDFTQLEKVIKQYKINNIVLFPDTGKKILKSKKGFRILNTKSMKEAVAFAYQYTKPGKVCLLSCASPSYSLWKNFEVKGDEFQKEVRALSKQ